jgi:hypothetical protein
MATANAMPIINAALTRTGDDPITSLDEGTPQAAVASANYDDLVNGLLAYPWKFASRTMQLAALDVIVDPPWLFAYERPADLLQPRVLEVNGCPIDYEILADKILCNTGSEVPVILKYTYRADESFWPKYFRVAVIATLESLFLRAIGERYSEAEARDKRAAQLQAAARNRDSQSPTARNPFRPRILAARGGFWPGDPFRRDPWWGR